MEEHNRGVPTIFVVPLIQVMVGVLLFVSLLYGRRDITALTLLVLGMISGTKLWAGMSLKHLKCHSSVDKIRMFPDEKLTLKVEVENKKFLPVWLQLKVPVSPLLHPSPGKTLLEKEGSLLWHQRASFQWELTAGRRGVHEIGRLYFFAGDLFAFISRGKRGQELHQIIVYPRLIALKPIPLPRHDFFGFPGAKSPVEDPIYILGTRDYQHGRSAKYIHWKASARLGRLQEKVFESTKQEKVLIAVDVEQFARRKARKEFERTLEVAASLAAQLDRENHAVGLVTNGVIIGGGSPVVPIARSNCQLPAILEVLARLEMNPQGQLTDMMRRVLNLTWGLSCAHFSCDVDEKVIAADQYFKDRKTPVVYFASRLPRLSVEDRPKSRYHIYHLQDICISNSERQ